MAADIHHFMLARTEPISSLPEKKARGKPMRPACLVSWRAADIHHFMLAPTEPIFWLPGEKVRRKPSASVTVPSPYFTLPRHGFVT